LGAQENRREIEIVLPRNRNGSGFTGSPGALRISSRRAWISSAPVTVLALLCGVLGVLQYRSIGQITRAERTIRYEALRSRLDAASEAFNREIANAVSALAPRRSQIEAEGLEPAYLEQYARSKQSSDHLFARIALAVSREGKPALLLLNRDTGKFSSVEWPSGWEPIRDSLMEKLRNGGLVPGLPPVGLVLDLPRFLMPPAGPPREQEWLLAELNLGYIRGVLLPSLINRYLSEEGRREYEVAVIDNRDPSNVIYRTGEPGTRLAYADADAAVPLLAEVLPDNPRNAARRVVSAGPERSDRPPPGRWRLLVRSREGSLAAIVRQSKRRDLAVLASILGLIVASISVLVRFSRQTQHLAEMQINFVAGVSHEFRTPLAVIRTAAYNLRRFHGQSDHVARYGRLIEGESGKLEALVGQVLRFAAAKSGHVIGDREPVDPAVVIAEVLESCRAAAEGTGVLIEEQIRKPLPLVLADAVALRQALQNLIDNAIKYGTEETKWIGFHAGAIFDETGPAVSIRVADRGPGIPADELTRLFDPFFRGRRALRDQVHGTGLGLNLVKTIIEAHGGSIRVESAPMRGSQFIVRIPASPAEVRSEFAYSAD
jgi:signal transduction histidine kinase